MEKLQLVLVDPMPELCAAWKRHFKNLPGVKIVQDHFEMLSQFDCMVSAANSFGLMDGGVDLAIIRFFGIDLMDKVQQHILSEYLGEQPVGTSFILETGNAQHPYLAHTPTMRVPMRITRTDNIYRAMWAMLLAVHQHNRQPEPKINVIACPGLGTLTGQVPVAEAARQMALAYRHYLWPLQQINWPDAQTRQQAIGFGGDPDD
ncbi:MAG: macro domain-containing protein [Acidobacteria bacterium]|nr:macro domain-containing protein [Acidobacteriota bacterium]